MEGVMVVRLKPSKKLALEMADMLTLSALEPDEEINWHDIREISQGVMATASIISRLTF